MPTRKKFFIRPLLLFFLGFFLGNGGLIKGDFTENIYEFFSLLIKKIFTFNLSNIDIFDFQKPSQFQVLPFILEEPNFQVPSNTKELISTNLGLADILGASPPNIPSFHFLNLLILFCFFESINFSFVDSQKQKNRLFSFTLQQLMEQKKTDDKEPFLTQTRFFRQNLIVFNPVKLGFFFGLFVDAFKVGS